MEIKIKSATVVTGLGADVIFLDAENLPTPFPEMQYAATLKVEARKGYGAEWVRSVFDIEPTIVSQRGMYGEIDHF